MFNNSFFFPIAFALTREFQIAYSLYFSLHKLLMLAIQSKIYAKNVSTFAWKNLNENVLFFDRDFLHVRLKTNCGVCDVELFVTRSNLKLNRAWASILLINGIRVQHTTRRAHRLNVTTTTLNVTLWLWWAAVNTEVTVKRMKQKRVKKNQHTTHNSRETMRCERYRQYAIWRLCMLVAALILCVFFFFLSFFNSFCCSG